MSHTPIVSRLNVRMLSFPRRTVTQKKKNVRTSQRQQASSPNATAAEWLERERNPRASGSEQSPQQLACDLGHPLFYGGDFNRRRERSEPVKGR